MNCVSIQDVIEVFEKFNFLPELCEKLTDWLTF